jgi:pimeloyl-ACP methyl ester carboxylesterase/class 3 adenylate cyclase
MDLETRYARAGDIRVAYQVVGEGPRDLVLVPGFVSNLELAWEHPPYERFMKRLSSFARVIVFDKRGSGLSDPVDRAATIEERIDDIRAVMDAVGCKRADVFAMSEGANMSAVFAASFPERLSALVLYGAYGRSTSTQDYPWGIPEAIRQLAVKEPEVETWGTGISLALLAPSRLQDKAMLRWWGRFERQSMSPAMARDVIRFNMEVDIREVLPSIRVPTLVIHSAEDVIPVQGARWLAEQIPDAQFVEVPGDDHWPWITEPDASVDEVEQFLTGVRHEHEPDRMLTTILFTDIVGSTERAAALGDKRWRDLLQQHDRLVSRELDRHRGREVKAIGDGVLATFDGPARAIGCARAICEQANMLGMEVRAGLHSGEVELRDEDVGGIAVHIGARVANMAGPGEVLVSSTVKDLVVGSGFEFTDRGTHPLKGAPGVWRLYAVGARGKQYGAVASGDERA